MKVYKDFSPPIPIGTFFMYDERGEETLPGYFFLIYIYIQRIKELARHLA